MTAWIWSSISLLLIRVLYWPVKKRAYLIEFLRIARSLALSLLLRLALLNADWWKPNSEVKLTPSTMPRLTTESGQPIAVPKWKIKRSTESSWTSSGIDLTKVSPLLIRTLNWISSGSSFFKSNGQDLLWSSLLKLEAAELPSTVIDWNLSKIFLQCRRVNGHSRVCG